MGHHARLCEEREQLCLHLESAIELYKDTEQAAHPHDRLAVQSVLRDIRHVLREDEDFEPLRRKDVIRLKKLLLDLRSHVNMIVLKCLVDDVWNIQMRVENIEQCREGASHHRSIPSTACQLPGQFISISHVLSVALRILQPSTTAQYPARLSSTFESKMILYET